MIDEKRKQDSGFYGHEFLLWLFYKTSEDSYFDLADFALDNIEVFLEDQISLESVLGEGFAEKIKSDDITGQRDVFDSVREGRIPSEVRVRIIKGQYEWVFTLRAMPLSLKSIKLPADSSKDEYETMEFRLFMMEMLDNIIRGLFSMFLMERDSGKLTENLKQFLGLEENE